MDTSGRCTVDLSDVVLGFCLSRGDGLCNVFVPQVTAGGAIIETGAGSDDDFVDALECLLPRDESHRHAHGSPGHGADLGVPPLAGEFCQGWCHHR